MIQLSHTAKEKYIKCPMAYYMHYILGLREEVVGSALPFGTAIDEAFGALTLGKTLDEAKQIFTEKWNYPEINGVKLDARDTSLIKYYSSDTKDGLDSDPWNSMFIKGKMLIEEYQKQIIPTFKDVLSVQEKIVIKNDYGDTIVGFADKVVKLLDGRVVVMDDKTASKSYSMEAVSNVDGPEGDKAKQLALYFEALRDKYDLDGAGFYVAEKNIRKREPRVRIQTIVDKVPEENIEKTFDEFEWVLHNIRAGNFQSNYPECNSYFGACVCEKYINSDFTDTSGLVKVKGKVQIDV